jgi:hypothetical protein
MPTSPGSRATSRPTGCAAICPTARHVRTPRANSSWSRAAWPRSSRCPRRSMPRPYIASGRSAGRSGACCRSGTAARSRQRPRRGRPEPPRPLAARARPPSADRSWAEAQPSSALRRSVSRERPAATSCATRSGSSAARCRASVPPSSPRMHRRDRPGRLRGAHPQPHALRPRSFTPSDSRPPRPRDRAASPGPGRTGRLRRRPATSSASRVARDRRDRRARRL